MATTKEKKFEEYIDVLKGDTLYIHADTGLEVGTALETSLTFKDEEGKELYVAEQEVYVEQSKSFNIIESAFHVPNIIKDNKIDETKVKTLHGVLLAGEPAKRYDIKEVKYRPNIPFLKKFFWSKEKSLNYVANGHDKKTYAKGSTKTEDVKLIQEALKKSGYDIGTFGPNKDGIDGDFGSTTEKNIKLFQKEYSQDNTKKPPEGITNVSLTQSKPSQYSYITLLPLEVNGIVNQQTLIAMDQALVTGWKHKEPDYKKAPWIKTAETQLGVSEFAGKHKENPQIREYYKAGKYLWATDDSGAVNAWCGCFVAWVMKKSGYDSVKNAFRAKSWISYGKKIDEPVHGAIGIKSRKGGGHTAFIVGKSKDGKYYYMLGGNQSDQVKVSKYKKEDWDMFVVPSEYDTTDATLPVYIKKADKSGKES